MTKPYQLAYGLDIAVFYNGEQTFYDVPPYTKPQQSVLDIIQNATMTVGHPEMIVGLHTDGDLFIVGRSLDWCVRVTLNQSAITQIVINAITPPLTDDDWLILSPQSKQYRGPIQASVQCALADGSVWNWNLKRETQETKYPVGITHVNFDAFFTRFEGLPKIKTILWSDSRLYNEAAKKQTRFIDTENRICEITSVTQHVCAYRVIGECTTDDSFQYCVASNAEQHVAYTLHDGRLTKLYADQEDVLPAELKNRTDIIQCLIYKEDMFDLYQFYVVTKAKQLIVFYRSYHWYATLRTDFLVEGDPATFSAQSSEQAVERIFLQPAFMQPIVFCLTTKNRFHDLYGKKQLMYGMATVPPELTA